MLAHICSCNVPYYSENDERLTLIPKILEILEVKIQLLDICLVYLLQQNTKNIIHSWIDYAGEINKTSHIK